MRLLGPKDASYTESHGLWEAMEKSWMNTYFLLLLTIDCLTERQLSNCTAKTRIGISLNSGFSIDTDSKLLCSKLPSTVE